MSKIAAVLVFATVTVLTGAALTAPACASAVDVFAIATTPWNSLSITTDPGVAITWLDNTKETQVIHFFNSGTTVANPSNPNWGSLLYEDQFGGRTTFGVATANTLLAGNIWSDPQPSESGSHQVYVARSGDFQVTGSGTGTFAIDYSFAASRSVDASSIPYPYISTSAQMHAELVLNELTNGVPSGGLNAVNDILLPQIVGSVNDSVAQTGIVTVQHQLSDGTYRLTSYTGSFLTVNVSEPPTVLLLTSSLGVLGALFGARFVRDRRAT